MAAPYAEQQRKMTDGLHAASRMLGDVKFHQHKDVDPSVATRWTEHHTDDFLSDQAAALATSLGYPIRRDGPDWTAELRLDPAILPAHTIAAPGGGSGRHVLLTGATGFVGAYLARELLERDNVARLHCLVRARDERDGLAASAPTSRATGCGRTTTRRASPRSPESSAPSDWGSARRTSGASARGSTPFSTPARA